MAEMLGGPQVFREFEKINFKFSLTEKTNAVEFVGSTGRNASWLFNKSIEIICVGMCDGYDSV